MSCMKCGNTDRKNLYLFSNEKLRGKVVFLCKECFDQESKPLGIENPKQTFGEDYN